MVSSYLISIFGIKSQAGNIGHEAHLGGALVGVLMTLLIKPAIIMESGWIVALVLLPILVFFIPNRLPSSVSFSG